MKGRGRPALDATSPSVKVTISLPTTAFDVLCAEARRQQQSLPALIRRLIDGHAVTVREKNPKK
jgi:hypothetical protein